MKRQVTIRYFLLWIVLPGFLWYAAIQGRSVTLHPKCIQTPQTCAKSELLPMDRFSVGMEDGVADGYSYFTQNLSGVLGIVVPAAWNTTQWVLTRSSPSLWLLATGTDALLVLQAVTWNGLFTEISHFFSQRPRPFVYANPVGQGAEPAHYTSFYSGHTSFAAVTQTMILILLFARGAPIWLMLTSLGVAEAMVFSTAYFRILAGRHFLTDVIAGAIAGTLVAFLTWSIYRRTPKAAIRSLNR